MRHDYKLPPEWDAMTDVEKSKWMTQERCRRQAMAQGTETTPDMERRKERVQRKLDAKDGAVDVTEVDEDTYTVEFKDE